ncbi:hypothetical protein E4U43_000409 [Claviceps pusilla]|uniref:Uncharacterized protein n=1 Tax=Claviceps pusilla TaxID=123648 RepID=A0A9P7NBL0_9HYPO|nr:hypothetical protein E4U43_000409 [Claviceps pusilla]
MNMGPRSQREPKSLAGSAAGGGGVDPGIQCYAVLADGGNTMVFFFNDARCGGAVVVFSIQCFACEAAPSLDCSSNGLFLPWVPGAGAGFWPCLLVTLASLFFPTRTDSPGAGRSCTKRQGTQGRQAGNSTASFHASIAFG